MISVSSFMVGMREKKEQSNTDEYLQRIQTGINKIILDDEWNLKQSRIVKRDDRKEKEGEKKKEEVREEKKGRKKKAGKT